jgi:hypothetical protein
VHNDGIMKEDSEHCGIPIYYKCVANDNNGGQDPHDG